MKAVNLLILLLFSATPLFAEQPLHAQKKFEQAQLIFDSTMDRLQNEESASVTTRRQFYDAARLFADLAQQLANRGEYSPNLFVNAGNAFYFAGDKPQALLWYLRAEAFKKTPEIRRAVAALRRDCKAEPWPHNRGSIGRALLFWHYDLGQALKQHLFIVLYLTGCVCLLACFVVQRRRVWLRAGLTLMIAGAALGVSDVVLTTHANHTRGVVLENTPGYAGDGEAYSVVVDSIIPGQEVHVIEDREDWQRVRLPDDSTCWIPAEAMSSIPMHRSS
jgi:hypothetical protein